LAKTLGLITFISKAVMVCGLGLAIGCLVHFRAELPPLLRGVLKSTGPILLAHAGGGIHGQIYTNSLEAIKASMQNGFRLIELDFELTSDGAVVLIHDWQETFVRLLNNHSGPITLAEFTEKRHVSPLTLLTGDEFLSLLPTLEGFCVVSDAKFSNPKFLSWLKENSKEVTRRFIPQVYSEDEIALAQQYGFKKTIFTAYRSNMADRNIIALSAHDQLFAITADISRAASITLLLPLMKRRVPLFVNTVNSGIEALTWHGRGVEGIYTDCLVPSKPNPLLSQLEALGCLR